MYKQNGGKPKLVAVADAPQFTTGFAHVSRAVLEVLHGMGFEVHLLAINWDGACPDHDRYPYRYYNPMPKGVAGELDLMGQRMLPVLLQQLQPDLVFLLNEISVLAQRYNSIPDLARYRVITFTSFESEYMPRWFMSGARQAQATVVFSEWARGVLAPHMEYPERLHVIPHGHDAATYKPLWNTLEEREALRGEIGIPPDCWLLFRCDRNEYRKQWPLNIEAFASFLQMSGAEDAYFYAHTAYDDYQGWRFDDLIDVYGRDMPDNRLITTDGYQTAWKATSHTNVNLLYNMADIYFSTTGGEAWGLPLHEAQAAGCPVLAPANSAIPEVVNGGWLVPATKRVNDIRCSEYLLPETEDVAKKLCELYNDRTLYDRAEWWKAREAGLRWASAHSWDQVLKPLPDIVERLMREPPPVKDEVVDPSQLLRQMVDGQEELKVGNVPS